jgi:hypothetical protein
MQAWVEPPRRTNRLKQPASALNAQYSLKRSQVLVIANASFAARGYNAELPSEKEPFGVNDSF